MSWCRMLSKMGSKSASSNTLFPVMLARKDPTAVPPSQPFKLFSLPSSPFSLSSSSSPSPSPMSRMSFSSSSTSASSHCATSPVPGRYLVWYSLSCSCSSSSSSSPSSGAGAAGGGDFGLGSSFPNSDSTGLSADVLAGMLVRDGKLHRFTLSAGGVLTMAALGGGKGSASKSWNVSGLKGGDGGGKVEKVAVSADSKPNHFTVSVGKTKLKLGANSEDEMEAWMQAISQASFRQQGP
mmetsp:Transcript_17774/g.36408  ORF Transcript_17774/g.36408 Transcript_17774/m.36408 type:complete len:238 (-) Transcript_17774:176-889(-)